MVLSNIKAGIFDHSGVLSDDRPPVYEANMILFDRYGLDRIAFEEWKRAAKASASDLLISFGAQAPKEQLDQEYAQTFQEVVSREIDPIKPTMYADAPEALDALRSRGLQLAIVSSHPKENLIRELTDYEIIKFFDEISGDPAPKTERLKEICSKFGILPQEAFFAEDTVYGLRSGHQAGTHCFALTTGYHSRERLESEGTAVAVVDSLTEILKHV